MCTRGLQFSHIRVQGMVPPLANKTAYLDDDEHPNRVGHFGMSRKLTGKALIKFEANRDVRQEDLDGVREIKADGGKRRKIDANSYVVRVRLKSGLSQVEFAAALGVSSTT